MRGNSRERIREFDYAAVKLTGGPLKDQFDRIYTSYIGLNNDRLLKVYRQRAGLPAPGKDMGGWYDADGFVPGHSLGQYISGLARYARSAGDSAAYTKVAALVDGFAATLGPNGYPFASKKAAATWPCYILDKYEIGLLDAYNLAHVAQAKDLLARVIYGSIPSIPDHTYDRGPNSPKQAPYDEPYILPENLFNSYELTGDRKFFEMGRTYLLNDAYFDPLARGENILPGKHAYSHVIALSSAAKAYEVLGDRKYLAAIRNAWDMLADTQQYASGGWGPKETFVPPHEGKLAQSLTTTHDHFETPCGCYAQFKLARYLLRFTGDARYGDGLERVLYNTILGARDPDGNGDFFYYSDYHAGAQKGYYHAKWPCCSGTLVQAVADYGINSYFRSDDGLYVNLFTPSEVRAANGVRVIQTTDYPRTGDIELRIAASAPVIFSLYIRVPGWLERPAHIDINGKRFDGAAQPQSFARIHRTWRNNDTVHVSFPLRVRTEPIDDRNPGMVAVMRGPLMMVAVNPPADIASTALALPQALQPTADPMSLQYDLGTQKVEFKPFYLIRNESYNTYFASLAYKL
ncbi:MAG TPA: beta-L-arabinofuranosidase domain-containing protein [Bryobacteraceae bacterium]|jgi:DUF1680 family protein|nr:beta-L-arabinofuranosidase domain-containing protein [Bryobacteraceae bacterium]